ncbi:MAG: ParB/RepB/Spo0J family partition protein [bacterium]|nr:ParB/RepB/Spo0J family partition protein [bacterium]
MPIQTLPLHLIDLSPHRPKGAVLRDTPELRHRIEEQGIVAPVVVRPIHGSERYEILANPQTYVAAGKLSIADIPVVIRDDLSEGEAQEIVRTHYGEKDINPIEEAEWLRERLDQLSVGDGESSIARLARVLGRSRSQLSRLLAMLELPIEVQEYIRCGALSAAHARPLVKVRSSVRQKSLALRAIENGWSSKKLADRAAGKLEEGHSPRGNEKGPDVTRLENRLTNLLGSKVDIDATKGVLSIQYYDLDVLDSILARLGYSDD